MGIPLNLFFDLKDASLSAVNNEPDSSPKRLEFLVDIFNNEFLISI